MRTAFRSSGIPLISPASRRGHIVCKQSEEPARFPTPLTADVLSSAARARRGGVHGQQCDIAEDFVAGSIWLLLQQRWLTEQVLGERNYETRQ